MKRWRKQKNDECTSLGSGSRGLPTRSQLSRAHMSDSYGGRVALITGCGSGIGKATTLKLASLGVRLALLERDLKEMEETLKEVKAKRADTLELLADISDEHAMSTIGGKIKERWNRLDFVVA